MSEAYHSIIRQLLVAEITHMWPQFSTAENDSLHDIAKLTEKVYERVKDTAPRLKVNERTELLIRSVRAEMAGR